MAEHLPNEWSLTNYGGPMDSQWGDSFHDRMIDVCRRQFGMSRLADALQLSHTASDNWYKIINYPESHDEMGNVRDRVAYVAGYGQGWRMSKVAAAGTLMSRGIPLFFMGGESGVDKQFAFSRGQNDDFFVLLNFGGWSGHKSLGELNLPSGEYCELWNSTWPAFAIQAEHEGEHTNDGRDARLSRQDWLHVPDYGAVILQRT